MTLRTVTFDQEEWQVVPKILTTDMACAGLNAPDLRRWWLDLLSAAPQPPAVEACKTVLELIDTLLAHVNEAHQSKSEDWKKAHWESADRSLDKLQSAIRSLYTAPPATEELRRDAERYKWFMENFKVYAMRDEDDNLVISAVPVTLKKIHGCNTVLEYIDAIRARSGK